jgi:hypothetical protein
VKAQGLNVQFVKNDKIVSCNSRSHKYIFITDKCLSPNVQTSMPFLNLETIILPCYYETVNFDNGFIYRQNYWMIQGQVDEGRQQQQPDLLSHELQHIQNIIQKNTREYNYIRQ